MSPSMKQLRMVMLSGVFVLVFGPLGFADPLPGPCIDLQQSRPVHFEGRLTYKIFPGPPNFADIAKGDKPEPAYILQLRKPICVSGDEFIEPSKPIDRIQIFPAHEDRKKLVSWKMLRTSIGKSVAVEGSEPFGAHTGHHHAPLLLPITRITNANRSAPK